MRVLSLSEIKNNNSYWKCICDCGNVKTVRSWNLQSGNTSSCGCGRKGWKVKNTENMKKHGLSQTRLYRIWAGMLSRCENENCNEYKWYGAMGISVCDEWHDLRTFIEWALNNGYEEKLTIERKDVSKNYEPSNCKWIPKNQQSRNRNDTVRVYHNGKYEPLIKVAEEMGLKWSTVKDRWYRGIRDTDRLLHNGDLRDLRK